MPRLTSRLDRVDTALPPPPLPPRQYDLTRLTPEQRLRLAELRARHTAVGSEGLTTPELDEIANLVGSLDRAPEP